MNKKSQSSVQSHTERESIFCLIVHNIEWSEAPPTLQSYPTLCVDHTVNMCCGCECEFWWRTEILSREVSCDCDFFGEELKYSRVVSRDILSYVSHCIFSFALALKLNDINQDKKGFYVYHLSKITFLVVAGDRRTSWIKRLCAHLVLLGAYLQAVLSCCRYVAGLRDWGG